MNNDQQVHRASTDVLHSLVRQIQQLEVADGHRTVIEQAQGILMVRLDIDADTAIDYLECTSMQSNGKLVEIAETICRTRELPDLDR